LAEIGTFSPAGSATTPQLNVVFSPELVGTLFAVAHQFSQQLLGEVQVGERHTCCSSEWAVAQHYTFIIPYANASHIIHH
jgi:hypothetical protein